MNTPDGKRPQQLVDVVLPCEGTGAVPLTCLQPFPPEPPSGSAPTCVEASICLRLAALMEAPGERRAGGVTDSGRSYLTPNKCV